MIVTALKLPAYAHGIDQAKMYRGIYVTLCEKKIDSFQMEQVCVLPKIPIDMRWILRSLPALQQIFGSAGVAVILRQIWRCGDSRPDFRAGDETM